MIGVVEACVIVLRYVLYHKLQQCQTNNILKINNLKTT